MSHKSNFPLSLINFATDFFVKDGAYESKDASKKKLKSSAKAICLPYKSLTVYNILLSSRRLATCFVSVLGL